MGANHLVTLVNDSRDVLASAGVEDPTRLLAPLLSAALDNALRLADDALTGPVSRGDRGTLEAHIRALRGTAYLQPYLAMAIRTMQRAHAAGRLSRAQCADLLEGIEQAEGERAGDRAGPHPRRAGRRPGPVGRAARPGRVLGLVPTMGALHAGHLALFDAARASARRWWPASSSTPCSSPRPRTWRATRAGSSEDLALCEQHGVDLVWAPDVAEIYPDGPVQVWVTAGELADQLEGPNRPGHFDGVLTVVTKLFAAVRPDRAYFGEKDYQQLMLIRRMVRDLGQQVQVVAVPTVREPDGLALSSRNVLLSPAERDSARSLSAALMAGRDAAGSAAAVLAAAGRCWPPPTGSRWSTWSCATPRWGRRR